MIYYCFRDTEDWLNKESYEGIEHFWGYNKNRESKFHIFKEFFDLWNETQLVSYFEFRYELKELAKLSFEDAGIPEIHIDNWMDLQDDDWIIPQDDDDWVGPNFKSLIGETTDDFVVGDYWVFNSVHGKSKRGFIKNRGKMFPSCGHAFRIGMLKQHFSNEDVRKMLEHHSYVKRFLDKEKIPYRRTGKLPITACRVIHTGSASYMFGAGGESLKRFVKTLELCLKCPDISTQPEWCKKYMKEFKKLIERFNKEIKML